MHFFVLLTALLFSFPAHANQGKQKPIKIAITQIVSHPSLNEIQRGILESLKEKGFGPENGVQYEISNASGDMRIASQIANKIAGQRPTVAIGITTPSAQTLAKTLKKSKTPLVFAAVTDPAQAHLVPSMERSGRFITGTSDFPPVVKQVQLIKIIDENTKNIGVIYNLSEQNAIQQISAFEKGAYKAGMHVIKLGVTKTSDIPQAVNRLVQKVDCFMVLNDNMIVSSLEALLSGAKAAGKPVYASDPDSVKRGALAALAHDQYLIGYQTGNMVAEILSGKSIQAIPPQAPQHSQFYFNQETADLLGIDGDRLEAAQKELVDQEARSSRELEKRL